MAGARGGVAARGVGGFGYEAGGLDGAGCDRVVVGRKGGGMLVVKGVIGTGWGEGGIDGFEVW